MVRFVFQYQIKETTLELQRGEKKKERGLGSAYYLSRGSYKGLSHPLKKNMSCFAPLAKGQTFRCPREAALGQRYGKVLGSEHSNPLQPEANTSPGLSSQCSAWWREHRTSSPSLKQASQNLPRERSRSTLRVFYYRNPTDLSYWVF